MLLARLQSLNPTFFDAEVLDRLLVTILHTQNAKFPAGQELLPFWPSLADLTKRVKILRLMSYHIGSTPDVF